MDKNMSNKYGSKPANGDAPCDTGVPRPLVSSGAPVGGGLSNGFAKAEKAVAAAEAAVAGAQAVVVDLEAKRGDAVRRGTDLADERAAIAFAAHTTQDEKATARLSEIHLAISMHASELASLDAALRAAGDKVDAAKAGLALELRRLDALKLRAASLAFSAHCRKLDKALDELVNVLYDVEPLRQKLDALGVAPTYEQFVVVGERPILLALSDTVFEGRVGRVLAPSERMTFSQLAASWTKSHDVAVASILGEQTNEEAA
jgi:hypothetical protein